MLDRRLSFSSAVLLVALTTAPSAVLAEPKLKLDRLSIDEGLSQVSVNAFLQDRTGFIWIGTQDGLNRFDGYQVRTFKRDPLDSESLANNLILTLHEDRDGKIWVRSLQAGVVSRYDPRTERFTRLFYTPEEPSAPAPGLPIAGLVYEDERRLWFPTTTGLERVDKASGRIEAFSPDPDDQVANVSSFLVDRAGVLWIGTFGSGLFRSTDGERFERIRHDPDEPASLSHDVVTFLVEDRAGVLWVATVSGLNRYRPDDGTFEHIVHDPGDPDSLPGDLIPRFSGGGGTQPNPHPVYEDRSGDLWIVTSAGLSRWERDHGRFHRYLGSADRPQAFVNPGITSLLQDRAGDVWIGTGGAGLFRYEPEADRFVSYVNNPADRTTLSSDFVVGIHEDRSGIVWLATTNGGLCRFSRSRHKFRHYARSPTDPPGFNDNMVFSLLEDRRGDLWVGTLAGGVYRLDSRRASVVERYYSDSAGGAGKRDLGANLSRTLIEDDRGQIWVGTAGGGVSVIDPERGEVVQRHVNDPSDPSSLPHNGVFDIFRDSRETWWFNTLNGWSRFDSATDSFKTFRNDPDDPASLVSNFTRFTYEDLSGRLWIGTTGGLSRFDRETETFAGYSHDPGDPSSLNNDNVMDVLDDGEGGLWVATYGGGLDHLDLARGTFTHLTERQGLPNDALYSVLPDDDGFLWISSNHGLSRFDPRRTTFLNFDTGDGLQGNEFNGRAFRKTSSGELLFGGVNGFNAFRPQELVINNTAPPVVLTAFRKFDQAVGFDAALATLDEIVLSWRDDYFSFEFAALDYSQPKANLYAYKLEGFDRDWVESGTRRWAGYTNLDGGSYTFRVRAANADGVWNDAGTALRVVLVPPPWKTWWAYGLYVFAVLGSVLGYQRHKTRVYREELRRERQETERQRLLAERLRQVDRMKDEFLANTSHELRTPLNGIIGLAESVLDGAAGPVADEVRSNLFMVASSGRRLARLVDDILDFSKLKNHQIQLRRTAVGLREVTDLVLTLSAPLVIDRGLELRNQVPHDLPLVSGDENRLQQILHNLVGNAIKFTAAGSVEVSAAAAGGFVEVTVSDTGVGIEPDKAEKVFDSFEQADASSAREHGGTGLGLTITRQLVELHGGTIGLESEPGEGTRVVFTLPAWKGEEPAIREPKASEQLARIRDWTVLAETGRNRSAAAAGPAPGLAAPAVGGGSIPAPARILAVDDEPINLQVLQNILSLSDYQVLQASDGPRALELLETDGRPDLILLDVMMPRMTGFEVTRRIRQRYSANDLPIILVTAKNQISDLMEGLASGANDYLTKPFSKNELLARIHTHLNLSRAHSVEAENRRRTEELEQARSIQLSMLPDRPPELESCDIAAYMRTATEVGGDYYDFFPQDDGSLYIVTGDATGHGISAGMMVSMTKSALKALEVQSPHILLRQLNGVFRTVSVGHMKMALNVAYLRDGEVAFASAAMPPVFVYRAGAGEVEEILVEGLPLGGLEDIEYPVRVFELLPGDAMVLISDGLPELADERRALLGYDAVRACVREHGQGSAQDLVDALVRLGESWGRHSDDDVTVVVVKKT